MDELCMPSESFLQRDKTHFWFLLFWIVTLNIHTAHSVELSCVLPCSHQKRETLSRKMAKTRATTMWWRGRGVLPWEVITLCLLRKAWCAGQLSISWSLWLHQGVCKYLLIQTALALSRCLSRALVDQSLLYLHWTCAFWVLSAFNPAQIGYVAISLHGNTHVKCKGRALFHILQKGFQTQIDWGPK